MKKLENFTGYSFTSDSEDCLLHVSNGYITFEQGKDIVCINLYELNELITVLKGYKKELNSL